MSKRGGSNVQHARNSVQRRKSSGQKSCPQGSSCPYQHEYQHNLEFCHEVSPVAASRSISSTRAIDHSSSFRGPSRRLGSGSELSTAVDGSRIINHFQPNIATVSTTRVAMRADEKQRMSDRRIKADYAVHSSSSSRGSGNRGTSEGSSSVGESDLTEVRCGICDRMISIFCIEDHLFAHETSSNISGQRSKDINDSGGERSVCSSHNISRSSGTSNDNAGARFGVATFSAEDYFHIPNEQFPNRRSSHTMMPMPKSVAMQHLELAGLPGYDQSQQQISMTQVADGGYAQQYDADYLMQHPELVEVIAAAAERDLLEVRSSHALSGWNRQTRPSFRSSPSSLMTTEGRASSAGQQVPDKALRAEQDREYQECLQADRERTEKEREEKRHAERMARLETEKKEEILAVEDSLRLADIALREKSARCLPAEPAFNLLGSSSTSSLSSSSSSYANVGADKVIALRLTLPSGRKLTRKFSVDQSIQVVFQYLYAQEDICGVSKRYFLRQAISLPKVTVGAAATSPTRAGSWVGAKTADIVCRKPGHAASAASGAAGNERERAPDDVIRRRDVRSLAALGILSNCHLIVREDDADDDDDDDINGDGVGDKDRHVIDEEKDKIREGSQRDGLPSSGAGAKRSALNGAVVGGAGGGAGWRTAACADMNLRMSPAPPNIAADWSGKGIVSGGRGQQRKEMPAQAEAAEKSSGWQGEQTVADVIDLVSTPHPHESVENLCSGGISSSSSSRKTSTARAAVGGEGQLGALVGRKRTRNAGDVVDLT